MAQLTIDKNKLSKNFDYLDALFKKHDIQWSITTKLLCGHKDLIQTVLDFDLNQYCDSRIDNLKVIKDIQPNAETILIKPPQLKLVNDVVKYADISLNSEKSTIQALSKAAEEQDVTHKVIIMIEMGEIREGVMRDSFVDFYASVFELSHIDVVGVGTNLSCMSGVLPNQDKLIQLSLYKQLVEAKFNKKINLNERFAAAQKLAKLPKNSAKIRIRNRCEITGRPHGYYRKLKMSRIALRELASMGKIPGMTKSSW